MKKAYLIFSILILLILSYFYVNTKKYTKKTQLSIALDTLIKHPEVCDFSARIDCSHPWGTQFFGFLYSQWFGNELNKDCHRRNRKKAINFSLMAFDKKFDYQNVPNQVFIEANIDSQNIDTFYANTHKITKKNLSNLPNSGYYRNVIMLQPISEHIIYTEFKIKMQNGYIPYVMSFYIIFDNKNNVKKIIYYPIQR